MAFSGAATGTPVPGNVATDDGRRPTGQPTVSSTAARASDVLAALQPSACLGHRSSTTEEVLQQAPGLRAGSTECLRQNSDASRRSEPWPDARTAWKQGTGASRGGLELHGGRAPAASSPSWSSRATHTLCCFFMRWRFCCCHAHTCTCCCRFHLTGAGRRRRGQVLQGFEMFMSGCWQPLTAQI